MWCIGVAFIIIFTGGGVLGESIRIINVLLGKVIGLSSFLL
ncbi:MAG: hypothetical protein AB8U25_02490 [Rickettsiales endosymbiont of Dermacentor nuttalli]